MAAAVTQPPPLVAAGRGGGGGGGFFGFVKDGVVILTRHRGLLLPLAALDAARLMALYVARTLALRFFATADVDLEAIVGIDDKLLFALLLLGKFFLVVGRGRWHLLSACAWVAYLVAHVALGFAIRAATAAAAVASCSAGSGERRHTLASLLLKGNSLRGPMATAVFGEMVLWPVAGVALLVVPAVYLGPEIATLVLLFLLVGLFFIFLYGAVCEVAVVVSVAEPGLRAAAAVGRARRLMRGARRMAQATLYSLAAWALRTAIWRMHAATVALLLPHTSRSIATARYYLPLNSVLVYLVLGALKVLCTATVTAYYFDCRRTEDEKAGHTE